MPLRNIGIVISFGLVALAALGCDDLSDFKTGKKSIFRGEVVGSDSEPAASSFIRTGFASHTRMELQFDPYATDVSGDDGDRATLVPGRVHTYACPADDTDCDADDGVQGPFDHARLEAIENLTHDALSEYTFPGFGRLRNYIYNVRFASAEDDGSAKVDRNAMLFVSLMDTSKIEVRAISPSVLSADGQSERFPALFGVFSLERQSK